MPYVRTTIQPGTPIKVSDAELLDLDRQGLVLEIVYPNVGPPATETVPLKTVSTADTSKTSPTSK